MPLRQSRQRWQGCRSAWSALQTSGGAASPGERQHAAKTRSPLSNTFFTSFTPACTLPPATSVAHWCLAMIGCSKCAAISLDSDLRHRAAHDPARSAPLPPPCHSADLRRHLVAGGRRLLWNLEGPRDLKESRDQGIRNNNDLISDTVMSWISEFVLGNVFWVLTWLTLSEHKF